MRLTFVCTFAHVTDSLASGKLSENQYQDGVAPLPLVPE